LRGQGEKRYTRLHCLIRSGGPQSRA